MEKETLKIEEVLDLQGQYIGPTVGVSMLPMLKNRRDTIVVKPKTERLKAMDVALYHRGEDYVLHRVIKPIDGGYIIRGDNCYADEYIPEEILEGFKQSRYLYRSREIARNIEDIFQKMEREYARPDEYTYNLLKCQTIEMFCLILRHPGSLEEATTGNELIDSIVRYIKQNYMNDIKLAAVAKMKSVSAEHLSRTFKSSTGLGFNEYVTLLRLRKAEEMIKTSPDKTISEIAYECGFNDGNYFSYKFRKMYGMSPIQHRNMQRI